MEKEKTKCRICCGSGFTGTFGVPRPGERPAETCQACGGSGVCPDCDGLGEVLDLEGSFALRDDWGAPVYKVCPACG